jgi:hypothetical protein
MEKKEKRKRIVHARLYDGMNIPVQDKKSTSMLSASEATLFKQAANPLGDPHKIY